MTRHSSHGDVGDRPTAAIAFDDADRRVIESYALTEMLLAAHVLQAEIRDICYADGIRSVTIVSGQDRVEFTYPIWWAANGASVSWQMQVTQPDGSELTAMTGLDADVPRGHLVRLLAAAADPAGLAGLVAAARIGTDEVARLLGIGL